MRETKPSKAGDHKKRKSKKRSMLKEKKKSRNIINKLEHCQSVEEEAKDKKENYPPMKRGYSEHCAPDTEEQEEKGFTGGQESK